MFPTPTSPSMHRDTLVPILERAALPLLLFTGALFVLLFISWFGILPRFTQFTVSSALLSPTEMAAYVSTLRADLQTEEQKRDRLVLPVNDPFYNELKAKKRAVMSVATLRTQLEEGIAGIGDTADAIFFEHLSLDTSAHTAIITGDVRHVGLRSMTVLASLVERMEALPFVAHLDPPSFSRDQSPDGTFHSPFTLTLTLQSSNP